MKLVVLDIFFLPISPPQMLFSPSVIHYGSLKFVIFPNGKN